MSRFINDFELVSLVKTHPILYDKYLARGQRYAKEKDIAWDIVSSQLGFSERACITRWKSIRDRFGKEYRRMQENPEEATNWKLFPNLMFLKNHYKHGNAATEEIIVKYEPKISKNKRLTNKLEEGNIDPDDLLINQNLISLVKAHPVLYHKQYIRDSKNLMAKNDAWIRISEILCISEEDAYKRWKKLRDRFAREYRYHKIHPEKPITWLYFPELKFLEGHYRKGVPLPLEKIRRENAANSVDSSVEENYDVEDSNFCDNNIVSDAIDQSMDYYEPSFNPMEDTHLTSNTTENLPILPLPVTTALPEEKIVNVISNMESLLSQTQDCLKNLKQQTTNKAIETIIETSEQPLLVRRMQLLLEGLSSEQRNLAKRKIFEFLCESQIKSESNEIIDDVMNVKVD